VKEVHYDRTYGIPFGYRALGDPGPHQVIHDNVLPKGQHQILKPKVFEELFAVLVIFFNPSIKSRTKIHPVIKSFLANAY
jgi:hypothetical protein